MNIIRYISRTGNQTFVVKVGDFDCVDCKLYSLCWRTSPLLSDSIYKSLPRPASPPQTRKHVAVASSLRPPHPFNHCVFPPARLCERSCNSTNSNTALAKWRTLLRAATTSGMSGRWEGLCERGTEGVKVWGGEGVDKMSETGKKCCENQRRISVEQEPGSLVSICNRTPPLQLAKASA